MRKRFSNRKGGQSNFRNRRSGGNFRNNNRRRRKTSTIDPSKYIHKPTELLEAKKYESQNLYADFPLEETLKKNITSKGYERPTEIQDMAIPHLVNGKDLIGVAATGSGKTDAFLIPLVNKSIKDESQNTLIILPTRELALQIEKELYSLTKGTGLRSVVVIGGLPVHKDIRKLRSKFDFLIGTPGRLTDLINRKVLKLDRFNNIVLDEVDRMLDMGFVNEITKIIGQLGSPRQSMFFSATMTSAAEKIANSLLTDPIKIEVAKIGAHKNIHQDVIKYGQRDDKVNVLREVLNTNDKRKVLIFTRTKRGADKLARKLDKQFGAEAIHGDKRQNARLNILKRFKESQTKILVATDVAARGINVPDIDLVVNYDEPETYDDYIHRVGRTGRAGKFGHAITFVE